MAAHRGGYRAGRTAECGYPAVPPPRTPLAGEHRGRIGNCRLARGVHCAAPAGDAAGCVAVAPRGRCAGTDGDGGAGWRAGGATDGVDLGAYRSGPRAVGVGTGRDAATLVGRAAASRAHANGGARAEHAVAGEPGAEGWLADGSADRTRAVWRLADHDRIAAGVGFAHHEDTRTPRWTCSVSWCLCGK